MPHIRAGEWEIFYREKEGKSIPVLLIHGAGGNGSLWGYVMRNLTDIRAIAPDLPGHGMSSGRAMDEIRLYAEAVDKFIKEIKIERCMVCGHSMGGAIVLELAMRNPPYLKGIGLFATGARLKVAPSVFHAISSLDEGTADSLAEFLLIKKEEKFKTILKEALLGAGPEVLKADFTACDRFDLMEKVQEIKIPTLILCGDKDFMTPMKYSEFLHEKIRNSRLIPVKDAGHMLMLEAPEVISEEIAFFLKDIDDNIPD